MLEQLSGTSVPPGLRGPSLIDQHGLPRVLLSGRRHLPRSCADSTHVKRLRHIENLYQHADRLRGSSALDDALGTLNDEALADTSALTQSEKPR
ncbi:hypothetical protein [Paraburkholderia sediminicola]|uniref:hypothetical protein n=1 Tax=Paraburkholderia sediminicola TaxID=458836 RepID=UPI0038B92C2D